MKEIGIFKLDLNSFVLTGGKNEIKLSPYMCGLLVYLYDNVNKTLSMEDIVLNVWGGKEGAKKSLYVYIPKLREILAEDEGLELDNTYGKGYGLKKHSK